MTRDPVALAELAYDRRESDVDEDEAERFWEAHEEWSKSYIALHGQPGAAMRVPEDWEED